MDIKTVWEGPAHLGEGPIWHPIENVLYWIDIANPTLHRLDPTTNDYQSWKMPALIGAIAPRKSGGVIAGVGDAVVLIDIPSGKITPITSVIEGRDDLRLNDGKCDRQGRFWVGAACADFNPPTGGLYRVDVDGTVSQMESGVTIANGMGWSPDEKTFYFTDSIKRKIHAYDFDQTSGSISNRRVFVDRSDQKSEPDGLTVDSEGFVWSAQWNAWEVIRFAPDGSVDRIIKMPVQRPTSCMFGGPNLTTLYITSCSKSLGENESLPTPSGSVFAIDVGVKGLEEPMWQDTMLTK